MSQHRQPTQPPSVASIVASCLISLACLAASMVVVRAPDPDLLHLLGALGWTLSGVMWTGTAVSRCVRRMEWMDRAETRGRAIALALEDPTSDSEPEPAPGHDLMPEWPEPVPQGQLGPDQTMVHRPDGRTFVVDNVPPPEHREETQRIIPPRTPHQASGPSAAALRPIRVPVFRNEFERATWAVEHNVPTEVLPRPERS